MFLLLISFQAALMKLKWSHANSASILKPYTEKVVYMYFIITVNSLWGCLHGGKVDHLIAICFLYFGLHAKGCTCP